jgi:hypothetical protein
MDTEKEGLSPYGDLMLVILENIELECVRDRSMSVMYISPSFSVISFAIARQIRPPASVLIDAI